LAKRIFVIVLDSLGAGALPDAAEWGDTGTHTLRRISASPEFCIDNMRLLGLGNVDGQDFLGAVQCPLAATARLGELSKGKDTTIGHWELAGIISPRPLPTYPEGFPQEILDEFSARTGRGWLCNKPYSGTEVIKDYGEEQRRTGKYIVYTSADSVFQIAAHEELIPLEELYEACRIAREILQGEHAVGRVIARPYVGDAENGYTRTANRHDYSLMPPARSVLDAVKEAGLACISVGKINDIFAGSGVTESIPTKGNADGMRVALELSQRDFEGFCFVNLVDFDSQYGHRQDVDGYARAIAEFDRWLPKFLANMGEEDALIITADHGCDPGDDDTDHTREYVPLLMYGSRIAPVQLGTRKTFADVAATVAHWLGVDYDCVGTSLLKGGAVTDEQLVEMAREAMQRSYSPYSHCKVGAALLAADGRVFTGCNVENAAYSPTNCAERTSLFKAVSEGVTQFEAIAVVGGRDGVIDGIFAPCGVCRQALREFCDPDSFRVLMGSREGIESRLLGELLPLSFSGSDL